MEWNVLTVAIGYEEYYPAVAGRLREAVLGRLEGERWRFEGVGGGVR